MTRILWSAPAVEQLELIRQPELRRRVYRAIGGLARFPLRGRTPPEATRYPDLDFPSDLRELVFPRLLRVFYRYDRKTDTVRILGMSFRGQEVGADWLSRLLES